MRWWLGGLFTGLGGLGRRAEIVVDWKFAFDGRPWLAVVPFMYIIGRYKYSVKESWCFRYTQD